jgi:type IV pilus assembly protein PilC
MNFIYKTKDLNGETHQGEIESSDQHTAVVILRRRGLIVISVTPKTTSTGFLDKYLNRISFSEIVTLTRQLATMVGAGLVLSEAVDILEEQQVNKKLKKVLQEVSEDIKGGLTLAAALAKHKDVFPPLYINLVKAGEASGKLDEVLVKMADSLEKDREFQAKVKGAMIYPAVVMSMMVVVIIIMMIFVIPKLTSLYKDSTLELPLPTKILIATSDVFVNFWYILILLGVVGVIAYKRWVKTAEGRLAMDKVLLKVPIVGKIIINVTMTNFNRTFGLLTTAGIPLLESINIVQDLTDNTVFKNALKASYSGVERGLSFSAQLTTLNIFPRIVSQMVKVGEETGKLDEIFNKLADYFESESDHLVKNLTVAIEPIVLIVLGVGVAFLVISIILPIYKLTTSF